MVWIWGVLGIGPETWLYLLSFEDGGRGLLIGVAVVFIISCTAGFCSTQMFVDQIDPWAAFQGKLFQLETSFLAATSIYPVARRSVRCAE